MPDLFNPIPRTHDVTALIAEAHGVIDEAIEQHRPSSVWALYSGGHDSLSSSYVASQHPAFRGVVHINTGIGISETHEVAKATAHQLGWPWLELTPPHLSYEQMVLRYGMPGPGGHLYPYSWLKERALRQFVASQKKSRQDRIMLITGVRSAESTRRMGNVAPIQREGAKLWVAPTHGWLKFDVERNITSNRLPRNPVVDELGMSGECFCGAFAKPGELQRIEDYDPQLGATICRLQKQCAAKGVHSRWGERPPPKLLDDAVTGQLSLMMCASCEFKQTVRA